METYIIKRYAEVEWNERQTAARHRSPADAADPPRPAQRGLARLLMTMVTVIRVGRLNVRRAAMTLSGDVGAGSR